MTLGYTCHWHATTEKRRFKQNNNVQKIIVKIFANYAEIMG